jgi:hypothetical protein
LARRALFTLLTGCIRRATHLLVETLLPDTYFFHTLGVIAVILSQARLDITGQRPAFGCEAWIIRRTALQMRGHDEPCAASSCALNLYADWSRLLLLLLP